MNSSLCSLLFSWKGNVNRREFFFLVIFIILLYFVLYNIVGFVVTDQFTVFLSPLILFNIYCIAAQRCNDIGKPKKTLFFALIPILGPLYLFAVLFFKKGTMSDAQGKKEEYYYLKNPDATSIPGIESTKRIVNEVTQLHPILVSRVETPKSVSEICSIITNSSGNISVGGGRFSMGGQTASPDSTHIDMRGMNQVIEFDKEKKTIKVEAGIRWCDIQKYIDPYDLSVSIMQTYANFTVGGSLSVNVHGRYIGLGPLILSVKSIDIVIASGEILTASREEHTEVFFGAIGGYNGLGVIVNAELKLEENVHVLRTNTKMEVEKYSEFFTQKIRSDKDVVFHNADIYPPCFKRLNAVTWAKTTDPVTVKTRLMDTNKSYTIDKIFFWIFSELKYGKWIRENIVDPLLFKGKKVHYRNYEAGYDIADLEPWSRKKSTYVLLEYFVPVENFEKFNSAMSEIFNRYSANIVNVSIRHAFPDNESYMSWAKKESFAFVVYYKQGTNAVEKEKVAIWTRELIDAVIQSEGAYYLPYQAHATVEQFHKAYPGAKKLFTLKSKLDPDFRFRNIIWDRYYEPESKNKKSDSEFVQVYSNTHTSDQFYLFLQNVYHLFPEEQFHELIQRAVKKYDTDKDVYQYVQDNLDTIKPFLSDVTYALPALKKQKEEMLRQCKILLGDTTAIDGYLEIGSTGRYINGFKNDFQISGNIFTLNDIAPDNSLADIFERGQFSKVAKHLDYKQYNSEIQDESLELITCFIGLHHVPLKILDTFVENMYKKLKPGGKFILRDHDAGSKEMATFCSLVHTVFNLGLGVSFEEDQKEFKNFHSIDYWSDLLVSKGFTKTEQQLLQHKDPSKNTLVIFTK